MSRKNSAAINSSQTSNEDTICEMTAIATLRQFGNMRKFSESNISTMDTTSFKPIEEEKLFSGKWVQLTQFKFEDGKGNERTAEGIQKRRQNGNSSNSAESVSTIAILRRHILCDSLVLVKQYRPVLKSYTLEFPAKVIEHSEGIDANEAALREVESDTGYTSSKVKYISPDVALDPDLTDGKLKLVSIIIDGDDPIGLASHMNGNESEKPSETEVIQVPINGLLDRLSEFNKNHVIVDSRVYAFAIGLKKGESLSQAKASPTTPLEG